MPLFAYRAINDQALVVEGTISADAPRTARDELRARRLVVESLAECASQRKRSFFPFRGAKRYAAVRSTFARELSTLLAGGIPLLDALDSLVKQQRGAFKTSLMALRERVASGKSLADAMREQSDTFDALSVHMVEAGESSGGLDGALDHLARFTERYVQLKDRVANALFYPLAVFALSSGVALFLMTVVVPMLLDSLLEAQKAIPWPTRILKAMSDFVRMHGLGLAAAAIVAVFALGAALATDRGRTLWHATLLKLPVVGSIARKQEIARLALVVSTMLASGVVLLQALEIAGRALRNVALQSSLVRAHTAIQSGREIGEALEEAGEFPPTVVQIFAVGQQSGRLEEMLLRLADNYDRDVQNASLRLAALMEPLLIVGLSAFVGFILFATVLPILEAGNAL